MCRTAKLKIHEAKADSVEGRIRQFSSNNCDVSPAEATRRPRDSSARCAAAPALPSVGPGA